ncbi:hypothetical protein AB8B21_02850 [Tardiphaga sp. 866_E4_N2_1]|uniref:hypothetical protein n=1 Tax=unclassified Tardiphaga TaxID=2631404 RepID=UPI003F2923B9
MPTVSDAQHQDFGAIEAAVKETTRGRAFLANYARRVQQSDTLTMLAMLGRLERLSHELASRIAELEAPNPSCGSHLMRPSIAGSMLQGAALVPVDYAATDAMPRIDELASVLGNLHRHVVQLASQCAGVDRQANSRTSIELDARALMPPDPALPSSQPAGGKDVADEDVLGSIAQALER